MKKEHLIIGAITLLVFACLASRVATQPPYVPVSDEAIAKLHCHYYEDAEANPTPTPKVAATVTDADTSVLLYYKNLPPSGQREIDNEIHKLERETGQ
jgi:hypothetical protein